MKKAIVMFEWEDNGGVLTYDDPRVLITDKPEEELEKLQQQYTSRGEPETIHYSWGKLFECSYKEHDRLETGVAYYVAEIIGSKEESNG